MKCPFCHDLENRVIDSRLTKDGGVIRRRRACFKCKRRFTTYERVEEVLPLVVKKDNRREVFDRLKIVAGLTKACEKRPVSAAAIEQAADRVERYVQERAEKEVPSSVIGESRRSGVISTSSRGTGHGVALSAGSLRGSASGSSR